MNKFVKQILSVVLIIGVAASMFTVTSFADTSNTNADEGTIIYENDFEDVSWTTLSGWADSMIKQTSGTAILDTTIGNKGKSLKIGSDGAAETYLFPYNAQDQYEKSNGTVEGDIHEISFDVRVDKVNRRYFMWRDGNNTEQKGLEFAWSNTVIYNGDSNTVGSYTTGEWHKIKYTFNVKKDTFALSFDGKEVAKGTAAFSTASRDQIMGVKLSELASAMYVDNIKYVIKAEQTASTPEEDADDEGTVIYENDFENVSWTTLSGWADSMIKQTSGTVTLDTTIGNKGKSLKIGSDGAAETYLFPYNAQDQYEKSNGTVEGDIHEISFDVRVDEVNRRYFKWRDGNNAEQKGLEFAWGNTVIYNGDSNTVGSYSTGEWHNIKYVFNVKKDTFALSFDGSEVATGTAAFSTASRDQIMGVQFAELASAMYVDNVKYVIKAEQTASTPEEDADDKGTVIYENDFENVSWTTVSGWADSMIKQTSGTVTLDTTIGNKGKSLKIGSDGAAETYLFPYNAQDQYEKSNGTVEGDIHEISFDVRVDVVNRRYFKWRDGNNTEQKGLEFAWSNTVIYTSDTDIVGSYSTGEWHNIKYVFNVKKDTFALSFDGNEVATGTAAFSTASKDQIMGVKLSELASAMYVDNIKYAIKADPSASTPEEDEPESDSASTWYEISTVQEQNFDDSPSTSGAWIGNLVNKLSGTWALDSSTKKGSSGNSLKVTGGNVALWVKEQFASQLPSGTIYKLSYDFNLASLPSTELGWDVKFDTAKWKPGFHIRANGDVALDGKVYASLKAGEWHNIAYVVDTSTGKYECYIDDKLATTVDLGAADTVSNTQIKSTGIDMYFDNVKLAIVDDEPASENPGGDDSGDKPADSDELAEHKKQFVQSVSKFVDFNSYGSVSDSATLEDQMLQLNQGAGWALSDTNSTTGSDTSGQSLKIIGTGLTDPVPRLLFYNKVGSGSVHEVSFDIYYDEISPYRKDIDYTLQSSSGEKWFGGIQIGTKGEVYNDGTAIGKTIKAGEWHTVTFFFDCINNKVWHLFDGETVYSGSCDAGYTNFSRMGIKTADVCTYVDNVSMIQYSMRPAALYASAKGYTAEVTMNASIDDTVSVNYQESKIDFLPLVTLWKDGVQVEAESVVYEADTKKFVITALSPIISSSQYTVKLDFSIASSEGINVSDDYEFSFTSEVNSFDVTSITTSDDGTITAKLVNTSGEDKTAVMVVVGKDSNGALTSLASSECTTVGAKGAVITLKPADTAAADFDVFFIDNWNSRLAVKRTIFDSAVNPDASPTLKASFDAESGVLSLSGVLGTAKDTAVVIGIASEALASNSDGTIKSNPFDSDSLPMFADLTFTGKNGTLSHQISFADDVATGTYYVYADSEAGRTYAKVIITDTDSTDTKAAVAKCNTETSVSALAAYLDQNIESLGVDYETSKGYITEIADRIITNKPTGGYTLSSVNDIISYAIAAAKIADGASVDSVMKEYADVFGCEYADYAALSADDKTAFDSLMKELAADDDILSFDDVALVAKVRAASGTWGELRDCMIANADALGINTGSTSTYMMISSSYRGEVFENIKAQTTKAASVKEIAAAFESSVYTVYNNHKNDNSGSGSGSSGSSSGGSYVNVGTSASTGTVVPVIGYSDIDGHFSKDAVEYLSAKKIISGYPDGTFAPDSPVTRAEFSKMIAAAFEIASAEGTSFADVQSSDWFSGYVASLSAQGIILGDGNMFYPNNRIIRQDAAVIIARALEAIGKSYEGEAAFEDMADVSSYASGAVGSMSKAGVIVGSNNRFYPQNNITRGEAAVMIYRAFNIRMGA